MAEELQHYKIIDHCRGCWGIDTFDPVLEMSAMPLAGSFCNTREEALRDFKFPLSWLYCCRCGLVQVGEDVSGKDLFKKYNYASSSVPGLVRHFEEYASYLISRYGKGSSIKLLEIGCNDGVLLNRLPDSWTLVGVDPSDVAKDAAINAKYNLANSPFTAALVEEKRWVESWNVVTGSNCFAHLSDLGEVFAGVALALKADGWFWVEVHDLEALLDGYQWDTIYHEHKVEWSVDSLKYCLSKHGFKLREMRRLPLHGGIIRCGFQKTGIAEEIRGFKGRYLIDLKKLREAYMNRYQTHAARELIESQEKRLPIAAYGASGRANVYLNQMPELNFSYIIDEAPLRKNKFVPGVGVPIVDRSALCEKPPAKMLITAWNYKDDIVKKNPEFKGKWLTAFSVV